MSRIVFTGDVYNTRGTKVANRTGTGSLFSSNLLAAVQYNERNIRMPGTQSGEASEGYESLWTGTNNNGTWSGLSCSGWNSASSSNSGSVGNHLNTEGRVSAFDDRTSGQSGTADSSCDEPKYIYCISQ